MENTNIVENKTIKIKDLLLWSDNPRFPSEYSKSKEDELINYYLGRSDFKLLDFVKEIINEIDLPQLEKIVVHEYEKQFFVYEGNRRLTAFKILANTNRIKDIGIRSKVNALKLSSNYKITTELSLECLVTKEKETALRYVDRKHSKGNNEVNWQDSERAHYKVRRGNRNQTQLVKIAFTKIIRDLNLPEEYKNRVLGKGFVTTLFRIITSTALKEKLRYSINEDGELIFGNKDYLKIISIIVLNVIEKQDFEGNIIDSRSLNSKEEQRKYLDSVKANQIKKVKEDIKENVTEDIFGEETIKTKNGKILPKTLNRKFLIPNGCRLLIKEPKINNIYRELRDNLVIDESSKAVPNAVGVLFRVFLEISLDYFAYCLENKTFSKNDTIKQKIPWVTNYLESKGIDKKRFSKINKVGSAKKEHTYLSIDNFHEYVHSHNTQPSPNDLKITWDNLQEFFEILFEEINKKKK